MPVRPPTRERMEAVVVSMRETLRARQKEAPDPVNLDAARSTSTQHFAAAAAWGVLAGGASLLSI